MKKLALVFLILYFSNDQWMFLCCSPDIPEIVMKGQVPQAEGFQEEVDGTETDGITTLGFTMLITFGIEMSSETLISAAEEEKMNVFSPSPFRGGGSL